MIDLGTGDGKAAQALASSEPRTFVIGIDASTRPMADVSRRAARSAHKGGRPNLLFVVASAEAPPPELAGVADEVRVVLPWGSLLRGLGGRDPVVLAGIGSLVRAGGCLAAYVSLSDRDAAAGVTAGELDRYHALAEAFRAAGLASLTVRHVTGEELRATHSTWWRRLAAGGPRPAWRIDAVRQPGVTKLGGRTHARDAASRG